ncbi:MATE family efflux transporter [Thermoactinospora rubra]|uniref:MATE family efflux transporter n=1 Tax=Thermoactinospora rubra TaxID=1088767 RepID=UPI001301F690|nr:MATE family efflux transporter [Thermoactinospora rubra]
MPRPHRTLLSSAVPLLLSMVTSTAGGLVGTAVLGHHATTALAAFALAMAVLNPATAAVAGALRGVVPFAARHRADPAAAVRILRDARWLALAAGTAGAAVVAAIPAIATLSGAPAAVVGELGGLPWLLAAYVLVFAAGGGANSVLIALGRSRQVLWSSVAATATDVALTVVLVPPLGLEGAGVAFVASALVGVTVANVCLRRIPGLAGESLWPGRPRFAEVVKLARVGVPMAGTILIKFAVLGLVTYAAARTGAVGAAAHAVVSSIAGLLFLAGLAVGQAAAPEVARAASAGEARRVVRAGLLLAAVGVGAAGLVVLLFREPVIGLFTDDAVVRATAFAVIPLMALSALLEACQAVAGFGLTGLKRSSWSLASFAIGYGTLAPAAHPVATAWGLTGLWIAIAATNALLVVLQGGGFLRHSGRLAPPVPAEHAGVTA